MGNAMDGPAISEEEHEVVLHAEQPVVAKEAVPVERVRLDTDTVTEQVQVSEELRKEEIEVDGVHDHDRRDLSLVHPLPRQGPTSATNSWRCGS